MFHAVLCVQSLHFDWVLLSKEAKHVRCSSSAFKLFLFELLKIIFLMIYCINACISGILRALAYEAAVPLICCFIILNALRKQEPVCFFKFADYGVFSNTSISVAESLIESFYFFSILISKKGSNLVISLRVRARRLLLVVVIFFKTEACIISCLVAFTFSQFSFLSIYTKEASSFVFSKSRNTGLWFPLSLTKFSIELKSAVDRDG